MSCAPIIAECMCQLHRHAAGTRQNRYFCDKLLSNYGRPIE